MVDIETTGHNTERNALLQISAVKFNYRSGQVSTDFFDRCMDIPFGREWDFETRSWWNKQGDTLQKIQSRAEDSYSVMKDFQRWLLADWPSEQPEGLQFWGKPTHFDFSWLQSYFKWFRLDFPPHYRYARDANSFMAGLRGDPEHPPFEKQVPPPEEAHNALFDTIWQIQMLLHAKKMTSQGEVLT